jgi:hypothetical protein
MPERPIICHEFHPLRKLAQALADKRVDPSVTRLLAPYLHGDTALYNAKRFANGSDTLEHWAEMHSGSLYLLLQDQPAAEPDYYPITWEDNGVAKSVVALAWVMKNAIEYLRRGGNVELDCSHPSMPPFVFSVPMTVCHNYGVPLGVLFGPTETADLYQLFAQALTADGTGFTKDELREMPLLSDEGAGLIAYGDKWHKDHFFCYRHWLESLGGRTIVTVLARRLLFTFSEAQYLDILPSVLSNYAEAVRNGDVTAKG